jgi:hypothetical protein
MGNGDQPSSPGGKPLRGKRLPPEKLADLAPCQDQIDKVKRTKTNRNTAISSERLGCELRRTCLQTLSPDVGCGSGTG